MFIFTIFCWCLLFTIITGQSSTPSVRPTLGPVYPVLNNDSILNFTFVYPANYQFDKLLVSFTIYDFINNEKLNPQPYPFAQASFTNSNISLPWVTPNTLFQAGDYIIGCFEWLQKDNNDTLIADTFQCILTRASVNSTLLSVAQPSTSTAVVSNTTATVYAYFPQALPYDQANTTANLNGTISPTMTNSSSNATYLNMNMFSFTNLMVNTKYNMCIYTQYANSRINGTYQMNTQCQTIMTPGVSSSHKMASNMIILIILLFISVFI